MALCRVQLVIPVGSRTSHSLCMSADRLALPGRLGRLRRGCVKNRRRTLGETTFGRRPETGGTAADVFVMRVAGTHMRHLTRTVLYDSYPDWAARS